MVSVLQRIGQNIIIMTVCDSGGKNWLVQTCLGELAVDTRFC